MQFKYLLLTRFIVLNVFFTSLVRRLWPGLARCYDKGPLGRTTLLLWQYFFMVRVCG